MSDTNLVTIEEPPMYPDEIVTRICEEIACTKNSMKLKEIWKYLNIENESMKIFILKCCLANNDLIPLIKGEIVKEKESLDVNDLINDENKENDFTFQVEENRLWIILVGSPKKESTIGRMAFRLLLEISNAKEKGITTSDLAKKTKQDLRSISGRLKKIGNLFQSIQVIQNGHAMRKVTLNRYAAKQGKGEREYVSLRDHLNQIVSITKASKNGIRQISDLAREMFNLKNGKIPKTFHSAVQWLCEKGYLRKVFVIPPHNPGVKVRCIQYQRDYIENTKTENYFEEDNYSDDMDEDEDEDNGEDAMEEEDDADEGEDETIYEGLDKATDSNLITEPIEDETNVKTITERNEMLMNRFYPFQNQVFSLAEKTGEKGLSTLDAIKTICGKDFKRTYTRVAEYTQTMANAKKGPITTLKLIRVYDFEGKKKFFRVFTEPNFNQAFGKDSITKIEPLQQLPSQTKSLSEIDDDNFLAINTTLRFGINSKGEEVFFWNGEDSEGLRSTAPTRVSKKSERIDKQKRKLEREAKEEKAKIKKIKLQKEDDILLNPTVTWNTNHAMNFYGFQVRSIIALKRQRSIIKTLTEMGGFAILRHQFFEDISRKLGLSGIIDKKTAKGDIRSLCDTKKIVSKVDENTKKRYIYLPTLNEEAVEQFLINEKDRKINEVGDILSSTNLYFFDPLAEKRFNRESKAMQRLRKFKESNSTLPKTRSKRKQSGRKIKSNEKDEASEKGRPTPESALEVPAKIKTESMNKKKSDKLNKPKPKFIKPTISFTLQKDTISVLVKAIVITKSITKEIQWDHITRLFPRNTIGNLKKKWAAKRIKMGNSGWKLYVQKWRNILVDGIKKEIVTMEDVENLDLSKLMKLWLDYKQKDESNVITLYKDYHDNKRKFILERDPQTNSARMSSVLSSVIQRETFLLKETYTVSDYSKNSTESNKTDDENTVRSVVRSILIDKLHTEINEIDALQNIPKEVIEKTLLEMARDRQIYLKGSKLTLTSTVNEFFDTGDTVDIFKKSTQYSSQLEEFLKGGNGIIISEEPKDTSVIGLIDIIARRFVNIYNIPMERENYRFYYSSRKYEVSTLTPPLILTIRKNNTKLYSTSKTIPIPLGAPYSRIWIDSTGALRKDVWDKCICFVLYTILFRPGITIKGILEYCSHIVSFSELSDICDWLLQKGCLQPLPFNGYNVSNQWSRVLV